MRVRCDDTESLIDLLLRGRATDIEEVSGLTTIVLDHVHGGHGKTGAVDHATNVAVHGNIVNTDLGGISLARIV